MIKISIKKDNLINKIVISGHSGYEEIGKDIVCASVSSIAITTVNAIIRIDNKAITCKQEDAYIEIDIIKHSEIIDTLINNMLELLKELEKNYSQYILID